MRYIRPRGFLENPSNSQTELDHRNTPGPSQPIKVLDGKKRAFSPVPELRENVTPSWKYNCLFGIMELPLNSTLLGPLPFHRTTKWLFPYHFLVSPPLPVPEPILPSPASFPNGSGRKGGPLRCLNHGGRWVRQCRFQVAASPRRVALPSLTECENPYARKARER